MRFIDLHCDTAGKLLYDGGNLKKNKYSVDIEKLKKGCALAQVFAFFIDVGEVKNPFLEFQTMHKNFMNELEKNIENIDLVTSLEELNIADKNEKIGAFLSIEDGEVLEGDIDNLKKAYDMGIRLITLTWNYKNTLGYPNYQYMYKDKGLTPLGVDMVKEMENLGIVPDASHLSDGGFYDLIKYCKKPFIATHSNSRYIKNHPRNLTDDMIKALANKGGIMGMNFCVNFVEGGDTTTIDGLVSHINHIRNIGGIDVIALGSDFDGISNSIEIKDASYMGMLSNALKKEGFKEEDIEKIFYKNALRLFMETLK